MICSGSRPDTVSTPAAESKCTATPSVVMSEIRMRLKNEGTYLHPRQSRHIRLTKEAPQQDVQIGGVH
jgi:hypothetical protein